MRINSCFLAVSIFCFLSCQKTEYAVGTRIVGLITNGQTNEPLANKAIGIMAGEDSTIIGQCITNTYGKYDIQIPVDTAFKYLSTLVLDSIPINKCPAYQIGGLLAHRKSFREINQIAWPVAYVQLELSHSAPPDSIIIDIDFFDINLGRASPDTRSYGQQSQPSGYRLKNSIVLANKPAKFRYSLKINNKWIDLINEEVTLLPGQIYRKEVVL